MSAHNLTQAEIQELITLNNQGRTGEAWQVRIPSVVCSIYLGYQF